MAAVALGGLALRGAMGKLLALLATHRAAIGLGAVFTLPQILRQSGERGIAEGQLELQLKTLKAGTEAGKKSLGRSERGAKGYMLQLEKVRADDRKQANEIMLMQMERQSKDRQMALLLQAMQTKAQTTQAKSGMVSLLRGGY